MESNFKNRLNNKTKNTGLATFNTEEIIEELGRRKRQPNPFPLDVFSKEIKPFLNALHEVYDLPIAYIGGCLLSAYSTAIGSAYVVSTNDKDFIYLPTWVALQGMTSSGKSLAINLIFKELKAIQEEFDANWKDTVKGMTDAKIAQLSMPTVLYRDSHIPTLVRGVLPTNPKGVCKMSDELIEWINGMDQLSKKEGTDQQFWLSSWNCTEYSAIRSGNQKFIVERPFVNVIGGSQDSVLGRMFGKDRDTTGFIFRLLFACADGKGKIANPDPEKEIPKEWEDLHRKSLNRLYKDLPIHDPTDTPRKCLLNPKAIRLFRTWTNERIAKINNLKDESDRELEASILGKIKEYALRFAAILHVAGRSFDSDYGKDFYTNFKQKEYIDEETMLKALRLADYFYESALDVFEKVQLGTTAPANVLIVATMLKLGRSKADIAEYLYHSKENKYSVKAWRQIEKWIKEYPKVFNAVAK